MDIQAEKLDIIHWLSTLEDKKIIRQLISFKNSSNESVQLSQEEKDAIDAGIKSAEEGRVLAHGEVAKMTKRKYPHLYK